MANMLQLITKNFFNKPVTRAFPLQPEREAFERSRGHIEFHNENCIYCGICMRKCPADAITVDRKENKWELNVLRCIICGECVQSCPKKTITMSNARRSADLEKEIYTDIKPKAETPANPATPKPAAKPAAAAAPASEQRIADGASDKPKIAD